MILTFRWPWLWYDLDAYFKLEMTPFSVEKIIKFYSFNHNYFLSNFNVLCLCFVCSMIISQPFQCYMFCIKWIRISTCSTFSVHMWQQFNIWEERWLGSRVYPWSFRETRVSNMSASFTGTSADGMWSSVLPVLYT